MRQYLPNEIQFRGLSLKTFEDLAEKFCPKGVSLSQYTGMMVRRFRYRIPVDEKELIYCAKPSDEYFFFNNQYFNGPLEFIQYYSLPEDILSDVQRCLSKDLIDTEASLMMLLRGHASNRINHKIADIEEAFLIEGKIFNSIAEVRNVFRFLDIKSIPLPELSAGNIIHQCDEYIVSSSLKIGDIKVRSIEEITDYIGESFWKVVTSLTAHYEGKSFTKSLWPFVNDTDSPVVVNGEVYRKLMDAFRMYAIVPHKAISKLSLKGEIVPDSIDSLFSSEMVGQNEFDMITIDGVTVYPQDLITMIGGRASVFVSNMVEKDADFYIKPMQEIVEKYVLSDTPVSSGKIV